MWFIIFLAVQSYGQGTGCKYFADDLTVMCVDIGLTHLPSLDQDWIPRIKILSFVGNHISYIDPHYIAKFSSLEVLDLRGQRGFFNCSSVSSLPSGLTVFSDCPKNEIRPSNTSNRPVLSSENHIEWGNVTTTENADAATFTTTANINTTVTNNATGGADDFTREWITQWDNDTRPTVHPLTIEFGTISVLLAAIILIGGVMIAIQCGYETHCKVNDTEVSYHPSRTEKHYKRTDSYELAQTDSQIDL